MNSTILIVDDNTIVRETIASLTREMGFTVIEAASIDGARTPLAHNDVDALLCDDDLGLGLSGAEFIGDNSSLMPTTVVLMSGKPKPEGLPGNVRYLPKPFTFRQLKTALSP
jgi:DNA-binding NtrC family response regulator